jgi:hypothetical protein
VKRFTILALTATAALAQVPATAAPAAAAPVATAAEEAPLAPVSMQLLQNHPGAPTGVEDVLLVPSANAGQKAVAFEWANGNNTQAYVLWKNYFAAAQYTGGADSTAKTLASFGLMFPSWGAGLSVAYADHSVEDASSNKLVTYQELNQLKVFGSAGLGGMDVFGSLAWKKPSPNQEYIPASGSSRTLPRTDSVLLTAGVRKYPAAGVEGLAWAAVGELGYSYDREDAGSNNGQTSWIGDLTGQVGYVFITDGITFLPGVDAFILYANGVDNPDYGMIAGVSPYAAIILPLFEHWTLKGGARYVAEQSLIDGTQGTPSTFDDEGLITNTVGSVGLRYTRNRWAFEGSISNGFLTNGPYFISGTSTAGLVGSLALTVNLK